MSAQQQKRFVSAYKVFIINRWRMPGHRWALCLFMPWKLSRGKGWLYIEAFGFGVSLVDDELDGLVKFAGSDG